MAEDLLVTALSFYPDEGAPLPALDRPIVQAPLLAAAKLALHDAMLSAGVSKVALGLRLGADEKAVRRTHDPLHQSHISSVQAAWRVMGKRRIVDVMNPA